VFCVHWLSLMLFTAWQACLLAFAPMEYVCCISSKVVGMLGWLLPVQRFEIRGPLGTFSACLGGMDLSPLDRLKLCWTVRAKRALLSLFVRWWCYVNLGSCWACGDAVWAWLYVHMISVWTILGIGRAGATCTGTAVGRHPVPNTTYLSDVQDSHWRKNIWHHSDASSRFSGLSPAEYNMIS